MSLPYIKQNAIGAIDGINKIFFSSVSYKSTTLAVFYNGILQKKNTDFTWTENGLNKFTLSVAPIPNDIIQVGYIPA